MVYITGDCHGSFNKFNTTNFPEQKDMTRDDYIIVCGDFGGIWDKGSMSEEFWLSWLADKNFTLLFVDGNHENFDRLNSNEFETVYYHGGLAHKIRDNIYHLIRGNIYELNGKKFFAFGGAESHDIKDGIINPADYPDKKSLAKVCDSMNRKNKLFRVNHISWWQEEMPNDEEKNFAVENLKLYNNKVDFIITHCAPQSVVSILSGGLYKPDELTTWFDVINQTAEFKKWYFGHYHDDIAVTDKHILLYNNITRIV